jgi:uncharacterized membrane protein YedE/YeeE
MTQPAKVLAFLDVSGSWDPSLVFVMAGAIAVHFALSRWIRRRERPLLDVRFHLPTATGLDAKLVTGSALFGVGWGLGGFCPGPAIVALGSGAMVAIVFVAAMALGMAGQSILERPRERADRSRDPSSREDGLARFG